jgi:hypothetical protein
MLHAPLEGDACILQPKRHGGVAEIAERGDECRGELVVRIVHRDLMEH